MFNAEKVEVKHVVVSRKNVEKLFFQRNKAVVALDNKYKNSAASRRCCRRGIDKLQIGNTFVWRLIREIDINIIIA